MKQEAIWEYFQNEGVAAFSGSVPRLSFLARQISPGEQALNIGVGAGQFERLAAARGVRIWALDPSDRSIASLRAALDLGERAKVGYSQEIPFADGLFDVVIMSEVIEHLDDEALRQTLPEIGRVLKPGGRFIGTVPARENLAENTVVCPSCQHHFHRWGHQQTFDAAGLESRLAAFFGDVEIQERFFAEWHGAGLSRKLAGLVKKTLSALRIGTYGANRNFYFIARHATARADR